MKYPASFVNRVKSHFRTSEVVGKFVNLKRQGREYSACCPFHEENTPSFTVNDEKGFYHCFGCGAHGDIITFVMEHERLSYVEALQYLARDAGIPIPKPDTQTQQKYDHEEKLLSLMDAANQWFMGQLTDSIGHSARQYLSARGLGFKSMEQFTIGYAPQKRDGLKFAMQQKGFNESQMIDAGLLIKVDGKASYDRFRGRVMFPIRRQDGRIIAFGGRLIERNDKAPKYLNSPETVLFKKNEVLFNLNHAGRKAKDAPYILVVEGYMDVIVLHSHGIECAVAPLGTAFSEQHLKQLWRYHKSPIFCFDGDRAGQKAMLRAADIALPHIRPDQLLRFCGLPNGEDPDSFVRSSGVDTLESLFKRALTISELLWNAYIGNRRFTTPEALASAEQKLMEAVGKIEDSNLRRRFISAFQNRIWHISKQQAVKGRMASGATTSGTKALSVKKSENGPVAPAMEQIFALVIRFPALLSDAEVEHVLCEWDWSITPYRACIQDMLADMNALSQDRYIMAEFFTREYPALDEELQKKYTQGVIPAQLYGRDGDEGLRDAKALFTRLKVKIEQTRMAGELDKMASIHRPDADEKRANQLLELIKLQQKAVAHSAENMNDSYV